MRSSVKPCGTSSIVSSAPQGGWLLSLGSQAGERGGGAAELAYMRHDGTRRALAWIESKPVRLNGAIPASQPRLLPRSKTREDATLVRLARSTTSAKFHLSPSDLDGTRKRSLLASSPSPKW